MQLSGRTALVTGASSGIGRATAIALARRGVTVWATGRDEQALAEVAARTGGSWLAADLGAAGEAERVARWAGAVDLLVNNAGIGWAGAFATMDPARAEELFRVNLLVPIRLVELVLPAMLERGVGHVVNVASISGHVGVRHEAVYSATKAGLIAFSESLRYELEGSGVAVSVVSPGAVRTAFFEREGRTYARSVPRLIGPEKVAEAIVGAVERDLPEVFVPRWMGFPARLRGALPGLYRRLAGRFG